MPKPDDTVTSQHLDAWLMALPMRERKLKQQRIIDRLRVSKRTVENWRGGRPIPSKHYPELQEIMKGADKVSVDFDPEVFDALSRKAQERGYKDVADYLAALSRLFLGATLLIATGHFIHPSEEQGIPRGNSSIHPTATGHHRSANFI